MILHVVHAEKFIAPFINFVNQNFDPSQHLFFVMGNTNKYPVPQNNNVVVVKRNFIHKIFALLWLSILMHRSNKIILHGLFRGRIILLLYIQRRLLKKCYWVIWGKDLYVYNTNKRNIAWSIKELIRRPVIKNIGHLVTYVRGDAALAQKWYGAIGKYEECIIYPSNLYSDYDIMNAEKKHINIQVGNSADPSNEHIEIFNMLYEFRDKNIKIYVPLSYGDKSNSKTVIKSGQEMFRDKFVPLTDFMPFESYLEFLSNIDIAIFNHKRQQGMGNAITLLGLGKKIYMQDGISSWDVFKELDIKVFDINKLSVDRLDPDTAESNRNKVKAYFSPENLKLQLQRIFL